MTKSRKRMLLSSIAMLLVALVALGSATYAWFTVSKTVTADGMEVKAISAAGLQISNTSATSGFSDTSVSFGQDSTTNFSLKPVSWDGATTSAFIPDGNVTNSTTGAFSGPFKATPSGQTPAVTASGTPSMGHNEYFAVYEVWVRSANAADTHTVSATVTLGGANASFVRCKLVDVTADTSYIYGDEADAAASVVKAAGSTKDTYAVTAAGSAQNVTGTDASTTGKKFQLFVWFDGEDSACVDAAKNADATIVIAFTATDM